MVSSTRAAASSVAKIDNGQAGATWASPKSPRARRRAEVATGAGTIIGAMWDSHVPSLGGGIFLWGGRGAPVVGAEAVGQCDALGAIQRALQRNCEAGSG